MTPLGLSRNRLAPVISDRTCPSMRTAFSGDPAHNIRDGVWPGERRTLTRADIELAKAMK